MISNNKQNNKMKKVTLFLGVLLSSLFAGAQVEYNHSVGLTYLMGMYSFEGEWAGEYVVENNTFGYPGVTYNARVDYAIDSDLSVSLSAYPTLCFSGSAGYNSRSGATGGSTFAFELPILFQLNMGHHATQDCRSDFGGFVAAGFNMGRFSGIGGIKGFNAQGGIKFFVKDRWYGLRHKYTKPFGL